MANGFDLSALEDYQREIMKKATVETPKECKKFLRKEGRKLNTKNKKVYKNCGIGEETGNLARGFKAGKVYSKGSKTNYCIRAFNNSPHAHLQNDGWVWKPHKNNRGLRGVMKRLGGKSSSGIKEKFIPGFKFIESANEQFKNVYDEDCEKFLDDVINEGL